METTACQIVIRPERGEIPVVRHHIRDWLAGHGVDPPFRDELLLVVTELTANAVEASPASLAVEVAVRLDGDEVAIDVANCGAAPGPIPVVDTGHAPGASAPSASAPADLVGRARGLRIVDALVDDLRATHLPPVTLISCRRRQPA